MENKECRWCIHFNSGDCSKIKKGIELDTNLVNLVEDGELTEYLRETLSDTLKPFLKKKSCEEDTEEIIQLFTDEVYDFFQDRLEANIGIHPYSEFYCKYWR